ncbi:hypothetical protein C8R43DRAFT_962756 [Mycena crocata]|nr:hypothetical protein C8R43DRAFT_962756 [Mycena crocata]
MEAKFSAQYPVTDDPFFLFHFTFIVCLWKMREDSQARESQGDTAVTCTRRLLYTVTCAPDGCRSIDARIRPALAGLRPSGDSRSDAYDVHWLSCDNDVLVLVRWTLTKVLSQTLDNTPPATHARAGGTFLNLDQSIIIVVGMTKRTKRLGASRQFGQDNHPPGIPCAGVCSDTSATTCPWAPGLPSEITIPYSDAEIGTTRREQRNINQTYPPRNPDVTRKVCVIRKIASGFPHSAERFLKSALPYGPIPGQGSKQALDRPRRCPFSAKEAGPISEKAGIGPRMLYPGHPNPILASSMYPIPHYLGSIRLCCDGHDIYSLPGARAGTSSEYNTPERRGWSPEETLARSVPLLVAFELLILDSRRQIRGWTTRSRRSEAQYSLACGCNAVARQDICHAVDTQKINSELDFEQTEPKLLQLKVTLLQPRPSSVRSRAHSDCLTIEPEPLSVKSDVDHHASTMELQLSVENPCARLVDPLPRRNSFLISDSEREVRGCQIGFKSVNCVWGPNEELVKGENFCAPSARSACGSHPSVASGDKIPENRIRGNNNGRSPSDLVGAFPSLPAISFRPFSECYWPPEYPGPPTRTPVSNFNHITSHHNSSHPSQAYLEGAPRCWNEDRMNIPLESSCLTGQQESYYLEGPPRSGCWESSPPQVTWNEVV